MVTIRRAEAQEAPIVAALSRLWSEEEVTFAYPASCEEQIVPLLGDFFWVAEREGTVVGYTFGSVRTSQYPVFPLNAPFLEIYEVYVHPEERGAGIGRRLIERIVEEAKTQGVRHALVGSSNMDGRGIAQFYERHGFKMWYVQMYR